METVDHRAHQLGRRQHGLATRSQLQAAGISSRTIRRRLAAGIWREPLPAVIDLATHRPSWQQALHQLLLAAGDGCASHWTAAHLHGFLDVARPTRFDVLILRGRHARVGGVRLHTTGALEPTERTAVDGLACTSRARTLCDLAAAGASVDALERFALDLERRRHGLGGEVEAILARRRGAPGRARVQAALDRLPADAAVLESPLEVGGVQTLRRLGLPAPRLQHEIRDHRGAVVKRVDGAWPGERLAVEFDGAAYHDPSEQRRADAAARQRLADLGWEVVVVRKSDLDAPEASAALNRLRSRLGGVDDDRDR